MAVRTPRVHLPSPQTCYARQTIATASAYVYIYVRVAHRGAYICIKYWLCVSSSQVAIHRRFHPLIKQLIDTRIPYWLDCVSAQLSRTLVDSWMDAFLFFSFFLSAAEETRLTAGNSLDGRTDGAANFHGWKLKRWLVEEDYDRPDLDGSFLMRSVVYSQWFLIVRQRNYRWRERFFRKWIFHDSNDDRHIIVKFNNPFFLSRQSWAKRKGLIIFKR